MGGSSWETLNLDFQHVLDDSAWNHHVFTGDLRHTMSSKPQSLSPADRLLPSSTWLVRGPRDTRDFLSFSNSYFHAPRRLGWLLVTAKAHLLVLKPLARPTSVVESYTALASPLPSRAGKELSMADPWAGSSRGPEPPMVTITNRGKGSSL